jgi:hypothetical protein
MSVACDAQNCSVAQQHPLDGASRLGHHRTIGTAQGSVRLAKLS